MNRAGKVWISMSGSKRGRICDLWKCLLLTRMETSGCKFWMVQLRVEGEGESAKVVVEGEAKSVKLSGSDSSKVPFHLPPTIPINSFNFFDPISSLENYIYFPRSCPNRTTHISQLQQVPFQSPFQPNSPLPMSISALPMNPHSHTHNSQSFSQSHSHHPSLSYASLPPNPQLQPAATLLPSSSSSLSNNQSSTPLSASVTRILTLSNFEASLKTRDLQNAFSIWENDKGGFRIKWIDDVTALVVFADAGVGEWLRPDVVYRA